MKELFLNRMKEYLQDEFELYKQTLEEDAYRGLRVNTSKISIDAFLNLQLCEMKPSSICQESFYIPQHLQKVGNHPAHLAGLCYIQEPSASSAVEVLDVQPHDWVLDLCAAPGGKSSQIAAKLNHTGFLLSNEIEHKRALVLMSNMERLGFGECMITNAHPQVLCEETRGWFDKILVDAPCSGEGMFKKHSQAMEDWSLEHVCMCKERQLHILDSAYHALKEGGVLVYSTCTYAMEENEEVVYAFLKAHPDLILMDTNTSFGRTGLAYKDLASHKLRRIFPMDKGEGHFVAKFQKQEAQQVEKRNVINNAKLPAYVITFMKEQIGSLPPYCILLQDKVYAKQTPFIKFKKVLIIRQGILIGDLIKNRIEPHQHFYASSLLQAQFKKVYNMSDEETISYLQGNLLAVAGFKGYTQLTWKHHPIAFAKGDGIVLKNKYPKGLRIR